MLEYYYSVTLLNLRDFSMSQIRENKHKQLTSHNVATMLMRTSLPVCVKNTHGLGIFVAWRKEAAP